MLKLYIIFNYNMLINSVFTVFYIIIFGFSGLTKYIFYINPNISYIFKYCTLSVNVHLEL